MSWDQDRVVDWIIAEFRKDKGIDLSADVMAMTRVKDAAEKAVSGLRSAESTNIELPFITADASGPKHLNIALSKTKFTQIIDKPGRSR